MTPVNWLRRQGFLLSAADATPSFIVMVVVVIVVGVIVVEVVVIDLQHAGLSSAAKVRM